MFVYVCFIWASYISEATGFVDWLEEGFMYEKSFETCVILHMTKFACPEVTLCSWQDVKKQLLTNQLTAVTAGYVWLVSPV